ncbi:hypothetical protein PQX77_018323 [Marasmius sp. AFHP31]|nr:hypothetical protein PQX77_018323 [Marasmius sp. AFHP31]
MANWGIPPKPGPNGCEPCDPAIEPLPQHTFKKPTAKPIKPPTPQRSVLGLDTLTKENQAAQRSSNGEQSPKSNVRIWGTQQYSSYPSASKTSSNSTSWTPALNSMYQLWVLGTLDNAASLDISNLCTFLKTHRFLERLLTRPDEYSDHFRKTADAIILR